MAHKIISDVRKERGKMVGGMQRLCDAYIALAYMDASRHKTEKSASSSVRPLERSSRVRRSHPPFVSPPPPPLQRRFPSPLTSPS